jgi:prepilin-type N-terminal cleavage/methylation domain-containing protein
VPYHTFLRFVGLDLVSGRSGLRAPKNLAAPRKARPCIDSKSYLLPAAGPGSQESKKRIHGGRTGFTLPEVMIASTLSVVVLAGVLGVFVFFGRTGLAVGHYQAMESELRRGLEIFSEDVRMATDIRWSDAWKITLSVPYADGSAHPVAYAFEPVQANALVGNLYRIHEDGRRELLVHDVSSDFAFQRYKLEQPGYSDNTAGNDLETKQLQLNLRTLRSTTGGPASTQAAISARYVLRNKHVSR